MSRFDVKVELNNAGVHSSGIKIKQYSYGVNMLRFLFYRGGNAFNPCEEFEKISLRIMRADGKSDEITVYDGKADDGLAVDKSGISYFEHKINYFDSFVPGVVSYEIFFYSVADGGIDGVAVSPRINLEVYKSISSFNIVDKKSMDFFAHLLDEIKGLQATVTYEQYITKLGEISDFLKNVENGAQVNVQSDWNENDETSDCFIKNKPSVDTAFDKKSNNAIANSVVAAEFAEFGSVVEQMGKDLEGAKQEIEQGAVYAYGTRNDLELHRANEYADEQHLTAQEKQNIKYIAMNVDAIIEEIERVDEDIDSVKSYMHQESERLDRLTDEVYGLEDRVLVLEAIPKTKVPTTLEVNTAYNFGSQNAALTLTFPSIANDGDVIYIGFVCREGLNLVVDTTNTFDFDLIPEKDTGYEIYAKCTTNLGVLRWILKHSEYSGVGE